MSAKDYKICPALFNVYIAKTSKKNPNLMTDDRRKITEEEILTLIDWYLDNKTDEGVHGIRFESTQRDGMIVQITFIKMEEKSK